MDIYSLLMTIASLSASFVAILGGFIVSRLITINSERSLYAGQLREVTGQLIYYRGVRNLIDKNRTEEDAIRYIYDHMTELVEGENLEDIYEENELQSIDIIDLEPLWKCAQEIKMRFDDCLDDEACKFNSDMIPVTIAEEYVGDLFAYEFCKMYAGWGFGEHDFENVPFRETGEWYERDNQKVLEYTTQIMLLEARENQLAVNLKVLKRPAGMIEGLALFALFSFFNIIMPLVLALFSFEQHNAVVISSVCILLLIIGLFATFIYLVWMLKWRKDDED